ncbi:MAG: GAF domain-containing protein [Anaerolineales bacterium]|nr:GAF domain-containing protein [Anaerolineales bacterium]
MTIQLLFSSFLLIITLLQILLAGYILLLDPKSPGPRTQAALLIVLSISNLANNTLQSTFTLKEATPWLIILLAIFNAIGPLLYLTSVATLRPHWLAKYRWFYQFVIALAFFPALALTLDVTGASQTFFGAFLLITLPTPAEFSSGLTVLRTAETGILHNLFFGIHLGFAALSLVCPVLVVAWKDRHSAPKTSQTASFFFLATFFTAVFQSRNNPLFEGSLAITITSLLFFSLVLFITLRFSSFDEQTYKIQRVFRKWSVFAKLMGAITIIILMISIAVGFTTFTVLRINTINSEGKKLTVLALAETRNIGAELLNEIVQLQELAQSPSIIATLDLQNRQYTTQTLETLQAEIAARELTWQTSSQETLTTEYLTRYPAPYNDLLAFQTISPEHQLIYLTDSQGIIVTGTTPPERYLSQEFTWWETIFKNGQGKIYISPLFYHASAQQYYIEIAIPVINAVNETQGILYSRYNLQNLLNRVNEVEFGETGKAAFFNALGYQLPETPTQPPLESGLNWEFISTLSQTWQVLPYFNEDRLIAWTVLGDLYPNSPLENVQWRIVFSQSNEEILTPIRLISLTSNTVLLGTVFIAIVLASILSRIITSPLDKLKENAAQISQGNLDTRIEDFTQDEFGTLASSFNTMADQLKRFIGNLEHQVDERTQALQQRANQIHAAVDIGNTVASIRDINELLPRVAQLVSERFGFYHVGIFFLSEDEEYAILRAANSAGGQRMLARNHRLKVGETGIVGYVAKQQRPRIALDVGADAIYFNNPDLPETRSEMALPIIAAGKLIGVLDVQSTQPQAFFPEDISILQLLADQLAVAIDNAHLFAQNQISLAETQSALDSARRAYRDLSREGWKNLAREARALAYRANAKGITSVSEPLPISLAPAARAGHPTLSASDTLAIPIKIQDHVAGIMQLKKEASENWSAKEINLIEAIVAQLGTAIESARLYKETQSSLIRTEALYQVGRAATSFEKTEDLLLAVADTIAGTLPAYRVLVCTLDLPSKKVLQFIENNGAPQEITPGLFDALMQGLTGWALQNRQTALSPKGYADPREDQNAQKHRLENRLGSIIVVPMFYQDRAVGTITAIKAYEEADFSKDDVELLTAMANQLAGALTNSELLLQTQKRALQLQTSAEISRVVSSILELEQLLPQVVELIRNRFGFYYVGIFLVDEARERALLRAGSGESGLNAMAEGYYLPLDNTSLIGQCILTNQTHIALDVGQDAIVFQNPHLPDTRSEMILPLASRTRTLGALTIQSHLPAAFTAEDLSVFQTMADQIASALDNAILFEANNRRLLTSTTLLEITQVVSTSIKLNQILSEITRRTAKVTQAYRCMVYLLDENNYIHPTMAQFADGHTDRKQWELFKALTSGPVSEVAIFADTLRLRRPLLINNVQARTDIIPLERVKPFHQQTILTIPLISQDRGLGIMMLDQISPIHSFNQEQIDLAVTIAGQAAAIIQNARLFQEQEKRSQALRQLNEISLELSQTQMDLAPAITTLSKRAMELLDSDGGGLWFWLEETKELELIHAFQAEGGHLVGQRLKMGEGLAGKAIKARQIQVVNDYATWEGHATVFTQLSIHAALAVPLLQQNEPLGVLVVNRSQLGSPYTVDQQNLALLLANQAASTIRTARLFQQTQESLASEQRERRIATTLARAAEKFGIAHGEHNIRLAMLEEIQAVILPDQITLYEWQDDLNAFKVDLRLPANGEEDSYQIGQILDPDTRPDLWKAFSSHDALYNAIRQPNGLTKEQFMLPWLSGNRTCGVIELFHTAQHVQIRDQDQEAIRGVVRLAAIAIQSARLFEQTQEALTRTESLYQVSQVAAAVENLPSLLQSVVDRIADSLPADRVLLITLDFENQQVTGFVESGLPTGSIVPLAYDELMNGLTGWVIQERKPALSVKTHKDHRETEEVYQHRLRAGAGSIIVVPLLYRDRIFGTITATNDVNNPDFNQEDVNLLIAMGNQAAAAIENARLFTQTQRRALLLQTAAEVSNAASSILELEQLLPAVVELIRDRFGMYYVGIFLADEIRRYAVLRAGTGEAGRIQISQRHRLRINDQSMIGRCILEARAQITQKIGTETVFFKNPYLPETRSELAVPLTASGQTLGAMTIQSTQPTAFSPDDITVLETLADQLAVAIENARFVAETRIRAENEQLLNQITAQLSHSLDLETILQTAVKEIGQLSRVREVAIHFGDTHMQMDAEELADSLTDSLTDSQHDLHLPAPDQASPL